MTDWKQIIATVAPTIATAASSPLAGATVKFLVDRFLTDDEKSTKQSSEKTLTKVLNNVNPERLAELKNLDAEFAKYMEKCGVDVFALEVEDRKDARNKHGSSKMPAILSMIMTVGVALILFALFKFNPPEETQALLYTLLGIVTREWAGSMHYWYGTTRGSSDKNQLLTKR